MASGSKENPLQLLQFPFSAGIDESTRDELTEPGQGWAVLENGRQDHRGGYSTRNGFAALPRALDDGSTNPTAAYRTFADGTTLARIANGAAHSAPQGQPSVQVYSPDQQLWWERGLISEASCRLNGAPSTGAATHLEDVETVSGITALSWLSLDGLGSAYAYLAVVDELTGAVLRAPERVGTSTAQAPMLLAKQGTYLVAARINTALTDIEAWSLDTADVTAGWVALGAALCADATGEYVLQSLPSASTSRVALLYANSSGGLSRLTLKTFTVAGGVLQTQTVDTNTVTPGAFSLGAVLGAAGDTLWLAWNEATLIRARGVDPSTITTDLATKATIMTMTTGCDYVGIAGSSTTGRARVWANDTDATVRGKMSTILTSAGAAVAGGSGTIVVPNVKMLRKPFQYAGRFYSAFDGGNDTPSLTSGYLQSNFIVCDWTEEVTYVRPVANPAPGLAGVGVYLHGKFIAGTTTSKYSVGLGVVRSSAATGSALAELDFADSRRWQPVAFGNSTYLSGGIVSGFDGARCAESNFLLHPPPPVAVPSATGISAAAGWRYVCVYEEVDADGNWHQSGLSDVSIATGAIVDKTMTVTTAPLAISSRLSAQGAQSTTVRVAFYRTLNGAVAPYYRLGTTINDTSAVTCVYVDTTTDATLAAAAKLYSQPGVIGTSQDKRPPPPFQCLASYNGMLVGASGSDVWYSGQNVSGEGVWFNPIFQIPVPGDGDITAMWVMDGTLFVAKRREIYAISGEAPSDNGASGGLGTPRRLAVDVGCIEARSPCVTALGTFFQSDRGIELLTRSQSVDWVGEPVQDTLASYPIITSATVEPASCTVLIECAAAETAGVVSGLGRTLVFDLSIRAWVSTDRRTNSAGTVDQPSQSAAMVYTGSAYRYAWLTATGIVHYETPGTYTDASGAIVAKRAISANIKAGGLQGHQHVNKVLLLAKYHTPHDLNLSFAYDYSSTYKTVRLYTAAQLLALSGSIPNMQIEHTMHDDARCEAVRVQLQDVTPSTGSIGTGQGATWIALAFEIVPQTGAYGLPDASR